MLWGYVRFLSGQLALLCRSLWAPGHETISAEQASVFNILEGTREHVFVAGKAGTGKSVLLRYFSDHSSKKLIKVAPTGVSAMNIGGQTIHSLFRLPPAITDPNNVAIKEDVRQVLRNIDAIVIDEISMVRADTIDCIDVVLRRARECAAPFGGIQVIAFGDVYQLPPVVEGADLRTYFESKYGGPYFFNASVWRSTHLRICELSNSFRQSDVQFTALLDAIRVGDRATWVFERLGSRVVSEGRAPCKIVTVTSTNAQAKKINLKRLALLPGEEVVYSAVVDGDMPGSLPTDSELTLKVGAQVVFTKNDPNGRWANGTIARVVSLGKSSVRIRCGHRTFVVAPATWDKLCYSYNQEQDILEQEISGSFTQFPLRLAWAITIHKSQGLTYSEVAVDLSGGSFAHGQTYVALSRCRSLSGLYLMSAIKPQDVIVDARVVEFMRQVQAA